MAARRFAAAVKAASDKRAAALAAEVAGAELTRASVLAFFRDNGLLTELTGKDGQDGKDGKDGINGRDGRDGVDGLPGADGRDGVDGKDGRNGRDGKDGLDGAPGPAGPAGANGKDAVSVIVPHVVSTAIMYESQNPLARAVSVTEHLSDGTVRTRTVKRNSFGQPTHLE